MMIATCNAEKKQVENSQPGWFPALKAIVCTMQTAQGRKVTLLGIGQSERQARIAAYAHVNHGHNPFDQEYAGGDLVNVSARLAALEHEATKWQDTLDESSRLIASSCPTAHIDLMNARTRLCLKNGELCFRDA